MRQHEIAIGDAIGSCIVDAGFSIGIGPLFFASVNVPGRIAETTGLYALSASAIVLATLALREKVEKTLGIICYLALVLICNVVLELRIH